MPDREAFGTLAEARVIIDSWRHDYNECRPHSSLAYRTRQRWPHLLKLRSGLTSLRSMRPPLRFDSATEQPHINNNPRTTNYIHAPSHFRGAGQEHRP